MKAMAKKKKSQPQSAIPFFMMAVFAFLAGFPIWLVLVLGLIGMLVLKLEKDKKALSNLPPLPPAESDGNQNTQSARNTARSEADLLAGPFGRPVPEATAPAPVPTPAPAPPSYREPIDAPKPPPWIEADYQPYPVYEDPIAKKPATRTQPSVAPVVTRASTTNNTGGKRGTTHPIARNLRSRSGARQAIIAMTVLGQPRSLQPYEFDPIQQSDVAPGRPS